MTALMSAVAKRIRENPRPSELFDNAKSIRVLTVLRIAAKMKKRSKPPRKPYIHMYYAATRTYSVKLKEK